MSIPRYLPVCLTLALLGAGQPVVASTLPSSTQACGVDVSDALLRTFYPTMTGRSPIVLPRTTAKRGRTVTTEVHGWQVVQADQTLGFVLVDEAMGKSRPITWLLAVDADLKVLGIEILAYRESHGGEVKRRDWRAQFRGAHSASPLQHGRDIDNIAGATISCRSITSGVRANLALLAQAKQTGQLPQATAAATDTATDTLDLDVDEGAYAFRSQVVMGTLLTVLVDDEPQQALQASTIVFEEVRRWERILSERDPNSELSVWLQAAKRAPTATATADLLGMLRAAQRLHSETQGACDASVGPLVRAWRAADARAELPAAHELDQARQACGWQWYAEDAHAGTWRVLQAGASLDFGGLAKGWALDRAAEKLRQAGLTRVLLDFGGQLLALDAPRGQAGWTVTPAHGLAEGQPFSLVHGSVAVSGDDERGLQIDGQRHSHIIDPRTGTPVAPHAPVLVWASSALDADAWATAVYIMGPSAIPLLEARGHRARQPRP